ncbi:MULTISPECIES: hypothetical protein [Trueperella]|uniref:hypothetical protein n=1 Tax=Trueperella TaxID=1069494 RepID=UPI000AA11D57|nr:MULTISPECIES: hypothetical protein [Trueperella]MCM3906994.1 S1 family peptidase [Trueperella bernardiae]
MKKNTLSLAFAGAALIAATGFGVATDDVSATPDVENDSRARSVADTPLAQLVEMPEPVEYYVASAGDIGLPPEDAPYTTDGFEIVGQYFDTDLGVGYVAISREDATSAKAELNLSPEYALESSNASHLRSDALSGDGRDSVVVVMSKYTAAQISSAMEQLTAHFQATGARVAFGYHAQSDTIELSGELTEGDLEVLPDTGVGYSFVPGYYQDDAYNENVRAPFVGGASILGYRQGNLYSCTSGIPAENSNGARGFFTAGHCFDLLSHVWTSSSRAGVSNSGRVTHKYNASIDAEFVSGKTYEGKILSGGERKPVAGTWHPMGSQGNRLCFQGRTSGNVCNNQVISYGISRCFGTGCYGNLISLRGGTSSQGGDSGGPVFANFGSSVRVTGMITGHFDPLVGQSTTYVTDWRAVRDNYGARLIYG